MRRIRTKINRGEELSKEELANLDNWSDRDIFICKKTLANLLHKSVLNKFNQIIRERNKQKEAERQRNLDDMHRVVNETKSKIRSSCPLLTEEIKILDSFEDSVVADLLLNHSSGMHGTVYHKLINIARNRNIDECYHLYRNSVRDDEDSSKSLTSRSIYSGLIDKIRRQF